MPLGGNSPTHDWLTDTPLWEQWNQLTSAMVSGSYEQKIGAKRGLDLLVPSPTVAMTWLQK